MQLRLGKFYPLQRKIDDFYNEKLSKKKERPITIGHFSDNAERFRVYLANQGSLGKV